MRLNGRSISSGTSSGEILISNAPISFFGGVDPESGVIVEQGHPLQGQSISGKILAFPFGKGSTVGSYTLYRLASNHRQPAGIINQNCETIIAVGCIISNIPCIDQVDISSLESGKIVSMDAEKGIVEVD